MELVIDTLVSIWHSMVLARGLLYRTSPPPLLEKYESLLTIQIALVSGETVVLRIISGATLSLYKTLIL